MKKNFFNKWLIASKWQKSVIDLVCVKYNSAILSINTRSFLKYSISISRETNLNQLGLEKAYVAPTLASYIDIHVYANKFFSRSSSGLFY